ncbi:DUF2933 domain-containing protein [Pseudogulbenkiania sp. MAI-1]|uniref:DUF2933 domain-containing protein n=1 Tax=Pseudogulbenkiania sp. MAI-1 TaxID=990370 RepID=UPI00045E7C26|nr:DUF2933 domain-containing protein [Pseudogulbenkiania sp. MAI-1]
MPDHENQGKGRARWVFIGFVLVAGFFLFTEHRAHVLGVLPYLLLLACPLMHIFMHHGHGHHHDSGQRSGDDSDRQHHGGKG